MAWGIDAFEEWFLEYHSSDEGRRRCRAVAQRQGVADMADDLATEWWLSIRTTLDGLRERGGRLPDWLDDEEGAKRYAARALANDALDLGRQRSRSPRTFSSMSRDDGPAVEETALVADTGSNPDEAVGWDQGLTGMVRDLNVMLRAHEGGCPGCKPEDAVRVALGTLELMRFPSGSATQDGRGGKTEWSQLVYEVLERIHPERMERAAGRMSASARQFHRRCSNCALDLLQRLAGDHLLGLGPEGLA